MYKAEIFYTEGWSETVVALSYEQAREFLLASEHGEVAAGDGYVRVFDMQDAEMVLNEQEEMVRV